MNSKQRVLTAACLGIPDRVPVVPLIFEEWIEKAGEELFRKILKETDSFIGIDFGIDFHGTYFGREGQERLTVETGSNTTTYTLQTPKGDLRWGFRDTGKTVAVCEVMYKDESDIDKLISMLEIPYSKPIPNFEKVNRWRERVGDDALITGGAPGAICLPATFFGDQEFLIRCAVNMPLIQDILKLANDNVIGCIDAQKEAEFEIYRTVGAEYASESFTSPSMFRELIPAYDKPLCDAIHAAGGISFYHCHDKINTLLEDMADIGMNILEPLEAPPCGNVNLADAKRRIGDRVCLMGNIDEMTVMESMDLDTVKQRAVQCIKDAAGGGGFILGGTSSGIYTQKVAEGFLAMAEISKSMAY